MHDRYKHNYNTHFKMDVLILLAVFSILLLPCCTTNAAAQPSFDAIYQFGDSISDTGNAVIEAGGNGGCHSLPYGQTFFNRPSGRCSDGLLMVDFFAQKFNLPLLDPYLNKSGDFTHGVNFAVAGATALNTTVGSTQSSLLVQLDWFKSHLSTKCSNPDECKQKLGNALFLVGEIGGNDYNGRAFGGTTNPDDLRKITPDVVQVIISTVNTLIGIGAKHIVVPGNFPAGCMTIYLARYKTSDPSAYDELGCLKNWNDLAAFHNSKLQDALKPIQQQNPDVAIVYGDYYSALQSVFQQGPSLGFDKNGLHRACCGAGGGDYNFDGNHMCGNQGFTVCPDPSTQVSWDGIHLTQHAYQIMAQQLVQNFK